MSESFIRRTIFTDSNTPMHTVISCRGCKHWNQWCIPSDGENSAIDLGNCSLIGVWEHARPLPERPASAHGNFMTLPDFGCSLWSPKNAD